jgi:predicted 2-oxoglutarate/Fe(II)-dependent dioxygenase YbiX
LIELLEIEHALDAAALDRIREEMRTVGGDPATVLGAAPEQRATSSARRATQVGISDATSAEVKRLLELHQPRIAAHFGRQLDGFEEPQFLRYGPGDYFVAHQDGNTPLVHDRSRFRRVSVVIFLSEQSEEPRPDTFCGGSLVLHGPYSEPARQVPLAPAPGTLVAFPSEMTHEVTPITHGERLSIVSWYRSEAGG